MRVRLILVLIAMMCFVLPFGVWAGEARSGVHVSRIPKHKLELYLKGVGSFRYNEKSNTWFSQEGKPVILKPVFIGRKNLPAYYVSGNLMADPCERGYTILTDRSYAIEISGDCDSEAPLHRYVSSFRLPKGAHAIRAKGKAWLGSD